MNGLPEFAVKQLKAEGKLDKFAKLTDEYVMDGKVRKTAERIALSEIAPDLFYSVERFEKDEKKRIEEEKKEEEARKAREKLEKRLRETKAAMDKIGGVGEDGEDKICGEDDGEGEKRKSRKKKRRKHESKLSYTETVRWAFVNARMGEVGIEDSPSDEAWCLMKAFQEKPEYGMDVYKQVVSAKVKKEEIEEIVDDDRWDGKSEYDILGGLDFNTQREVL